MVKQDPWLEYILNRSDRKKKNCPKCGKGKEGKDSYCDDCYKEYLGTHAGGRGDD